MSVISRRLFYQTLESSSRATEDCFELIFMCEISLVPTRERSFQHFFIPQQQISLFPKQHDCGSIPGTTGLGLGKHHV